MSCSFKVNKKHIIQRSKITIFSSVCFSRFNQVFDCWKIISTMRSKQVYRLSSWYHSNMINMKNLNNLFVYYRLYTGFKLPEEELLLVLVDEWRKSFCFWFFKLYYGFLPLNRRLIRHFNWLLWLLLRGNFLRLNYF